MAPPCDKSLWIYPSTSLNYSPHAKFECVQMWLSSTEKQLEFPIAPFSLDIQKARHKIYIQNGCLQCNLPFD
jgi:hypothetical protein